MNIDVLANMYTLVCDQIFLSFQGLIISQKHIGACSSLSVDVLDPPDPPVFNPLFVF